MKIQIVSDIHLEFYNYKKSYNILKPAGDILCILGDLCCCNKTESRKIITFFEGISRRYKFILWVPGNHEYYSESKRKAESARTIDNRCYKICDKFDNIYYLKKKSFSVKAGRKTYHFIGTTLWTYIPDEMKKKIGRMMSDYESIFTTDDGALRKITCDDVNKWHLSERKFLRDEIRKKKKSEQDIIIVLTHHKPFCSPDDYDDECESMAYESDQSKLLKSGKIKYWFYGHTHRHLKLTRVYKTIIASNPKGYPYQRTRYNKEFIIRC